MRSGQFGMLIRRAALWSLMAALAVPVVSPCQASLSEPVTTIARLVAIVAEQERSCRFVAGTGVLLGVGEFGGKTVPGGGTHLRFVMECDPSGRSFLDYQLKTLYNYNEGRIAYDSTRFGFDGRVSWMHRRATQMEGQERIELSEGSVEPDRHVYHRYEPATGWSATLPGFYAEREALFSDWLTRPENSFQVDDRGDRVVLSTVAKSGVREEWSLSREWALCLRSHAKWNAEGRKVQTMDVVEAVQLNPLFWYPTRIEYWYETAGKLTNLRKEIEVTDVRQLADVPEDQFAPKFPHGTYVTDRLTGTTVRIAAPDQEIGERLSRQSQELSQLVRYDSPGASSSWLPWGLAAGVLGSAAIACWWLRRRRRPMRTRRGPVGGAAMLALATVALAPATAQSGWMLEQAGGLQVANPGVLAAALVLRCHDVPSEIGSLARRLGCSDTRIEAVSLARIASVLRADGLQVDGLRGHGLEQVLADCRAVRGHAVLALRVDALSSNIVVVAPGANGVVIAWPAGEVAEFAMDSRRVAWLRDHLDGDGFLVSGAAGRPQPWDVATAATQHIEVGWVEAAVHVLRRPIVNRLATALRLESQAASCACVEVVALEPPCLEPGAVGELVVRVHGARLPSGASTQHVDVAVHSGGVTLQRRVSVGAARSAVAPVAPAAVLPGRLEARVGAHGPAADFVTVVVPDGGQVLGWEGSPGVTAQPSSLRSMPGGVQSRYLVTWAAERAWVAFVVRNAEGVEARVACRLRLLPSEEATHGAPR